MKQQKTSGVSKLVASLLGAALLGLATQNAMALTAAGAIVDNTASLTYVVGGVAQNSINSSPTGNSTQNGVTTAVAGVGNGAATQFLVDYKVDLSVTGGTVVNVTPGQGSVGNAFPTFPVAGAVSAYTVQNLSNATQNFNLAVVQPAGTVLAPTNATVGVTPIADVFDTTSNTVYVSNSATFDGTAVAASSIVDLAPNAIKYVYVVSNVPVAALNAQSALLGLQATALWPSATTMALPANGWMAASGAVANGAITATPAATANNTSLTVVDIVFADAASVVAGDIARDAKHSAYDALTVSSAALSVKKSVALLCDPVNGNTNPMNIPGAAVQYAITITNTGNGPASLTQISDALAASVVWDAGLISGVGAGSACVAGAATSLSPSGFSAVKSAGPAATAAATTAAAAAAYTAPGVTGQQTTAGAATTGAVGAQTVTVDFPTLAGAAVGAAGANTVLPGMSFIIVYFNTFVQ